MSVPPAQPPTSSSRNQPLPQEQQQSSSSTVLSASSITILSDSENYDGNNEHSSSGDPSDGPSPPESAPSPPLKQQSQSPVILYTPPTLWSLFRGAAINLFLPFVNGLMLGFGELFANEIAFRLGWSGTNIFPSHRTSRSIGPGVELQDDPIERRKRSGRELDMYTSLE